MNRSNTSCVHVPKLAGSAVHMRTGRSPVVDQPVVSRSAAAACHVPKLAGSAVHMRTSTQLCSSTRQWPAWSRICRGRQFECKPVGYQLCPSAQERVRPGPGVGVLEFRMRPGWSLPVSRVGSPYVGRFGLAPPRGPIKFVRLHADSSLNYEYILQHQLRSWIRPTRQRFTSVSAVPLSTEPSSVFTTLLSPSDCSRLIFQLLVFKLLV